MAPRKIGREATDQDLVERTLEGEQGAFEVIVKRYQRKVMTTALRILGDLENARDASQEAFIRVYRHLHSYDPCRSFSTWLYRIVVNVCYDNARRENRRPQTVALDDVRANERLRTGNPGEWMSDVYPVILSIVNELSIEQRTAFVLRDVEGCTTRETASIMDCPEGTVRSHLHNARLRLRRMLMRRCPEIAEERKNEM